MQLRPAPARLPAALKQKNVYHKVIEVYHCWPHQHKKKAKVTGRGAWQKKIEETKNQRPQLAASSKWKSSRSPN